MSRPDQKGEWAKPSALVMIAAYIAVMGAAIFGIATVARNDVRTFANAIDAVADLPLMGEAKSVDTLPRALRSMEWREKAMPVVVETDAFPHARPAPTTFERLSTEEIAEIKKTAEEREERIVSDDASPWHDGEKQTYKTMCVRLCDGAYFPISFATTRNNFAKDEAQCADRCGSPARLFVFPNPGGNPEMMRDRSGHSYVALPTAFQFRQGTVTGCSCKSQPWEMASKARHRLYALEADAAAGKSINTAELESLRSNRADAEDEASSRKLSGGPVEYPSATTATLPYAPSQRVGNGVKTKSVTPAALPEPIKVRAVNRQTIVKLRTPVPTPAQSMPPEKEIAALEVVEDPDLERADFGRVEGHTNTPADADQNPASSVNSIVETEPAETTISDDMAAERAKKTIRQGAKRRRARNTETDEPPVQGYWTARGYAQQSIWGVGPNAHGAPRGNSARDTFARNFY